MIDLYLLLPAVVQAAAAAADDDGNGTQLIVAALGSSAIAAVLAALVTGLFTKRKLGAEATEIITKAASGVVESLNAEIVRVNSAMADVRTEQFAERERHAIERAADRERFTRELEARDRVLQLHVAWDMLVTAKLAEHGIDVPAPPALKPPLRHSFAADEE